MKKIIVGILFSSVLISSGISNAKTEDNYREYSTYTQTGTYTTFGSWKRASSIISTGDADSATITISTNITCGESFSVSGSYEKDLIRAGASFTWHRSISRSETRSFTVNGRNRRGRAYFRPNLRVTVGLLKRYSNWDGFLGQSQELGYSPQYNDSGVLDGEFTFFEE